MEISYSLRRDEYTTALEAVVGSMSATEMHRDWTRRLRLVPWIDFFALILGTVVILIVEPVAWRGLAIVWIVLLLSKAAIGWIVEGIHKTQLGVAYEPRRHSDVVASFDAESASYSGPDHRQSWNWPLLQRFHELPDIYVLEFAGFEMLAVPRRSFASGEQAEAWARGIRGRLDAGTGAEFKTGAS